MEKEQKYEDAVKELELLVKEIENPESSLVDVAKKVEKAVALINYCRKTLRKDSENVMSLLD